MKRILIHVAAALLAFVGAGLIALYVIALVGGEDVRDANAIAGFGASALVATILLEIALARGGGGQRVPSVRFPPLWLSLSAFVTTLALGGAAVLTDRAPAAEPVIAVAAVATMFAFFGRLIALWTPGKRIPGYAVLSTTVWGMIVATTVAVLAQLAIVATLFAGVWLGLTTSGLDMTDRLVEDLAAEAFLEQSASDLAGTATVVIAVFSLYAVVAPLTEELMKLLGVVVVLQRQPLARYPAFAAGIFVGLGFALVETIGYALGSGEGWPLVLAARAPVALMHIAGASLSATGWYLQRTRGGYALVGYFVAAVLVHAAWNGLIVSLMLSWMSLPDPENPAPAVVIAVLLVLGLLGLVLAGSAAWVVLNARRWGRDYTDPGATVNEPAAPWRAGTPSTYAHIVSPSIGNEG